MGLELPAKLFRHLEGQAVAIPPGLELPGEDVVVRQDGHRLVIEPTPTSPKAANPANQALLDLLASWEPMDEEIGPIEDTPPRPVNL